MTTIDGSLSADEKRMLLRLQEKLTIKVGESSPSEAEALVNLRELGLVHLESGALNFWVLTTAGIATARNL